MELNAKFPPIVSAFMQDNARHRWIVGPFGSGKSFGNIVEVVRRATMQAPSTLDGRRKTRIAVVRNTQPQLRDTVLKSWFDIFPNGSIGTYKETGKTYFIKQDDVDAEIIFRALDDASDVKNLLSLELTACFINEFRDIPREIIEALDGRIGRYPRMSEGGPSWVGMFGDSNPPEEDSWWHRMLEGVDPDDAKIKKPNGWHVYKQPPAMIKLADGVYEPNPLAENIENLPPGYYENLVKGKSEEYISVYVLSRYGRSKAGKAVHTMFNKDVHVAKQPLIPNKENLLLVSADFGLTPAIVLMQQDAFGRVLFLDEVVTFGMGLERAIETKLLPLLRQRFDGFDMFVTGDPSGNTGSQSDEVSCSQIFQRYRRKGLGKVKFAYSNNPIHRQGAMDKFLSMLVDRGRPALQIDPRCEWLIQALNGKYHYPLAKNGIVKESPEKNEWSHIAEAAQYGCMYFEKGGRRKAEHRDEMDYLTALQMQRSNQNHYSMPR